MFRLSFKYLGKDFTLTDCYGISFSPAGRNMYVKVKKNGRIVTQSYYTEYVRAFNFSFLGGELYYGSRKF